MATHGTKTRTGSADCCLMSQILNWPMELTAATSDWVRNETAFSVQLSAPSVTQWCNYMFVKIYKIIYLFTVKLHIFGGHRLHIYSYK